VTNFELSPEMKERIERAVKAELADRLRERLQPTFDLLDRALVYGTASLTPEEREIVSKWTGGNGE
jgi:hypothetical protein